MIQIVCARSYGELRRFFEAGRLLHTEEPCWKEPEMWGGFSALSPRCNPFLRNGTHMLLMAVESGRVLARVLTGVGWADNAPHLGGEGYFALFDCAPREDAVRPLLDAACAFQRAAGSGRLLGPMPPCDYDLGLGVLICGFDGPPARFNVYNAPHYGAFLEAYGFQPWMDHYAYRYAVDDLPEGQMRTVTERAMRRFSFAICTARLRDRRKTCEMVRRVMNRGEASPSDAEFQSFFGRFARACAEDLFLLAMAGAEPVGLAIAVPSDAQTIRLVTLWVVPAWRNRGVSYALLSQLLVAVRRRGALFIDASTIRADNIASIRYAEGLGGMRYRTYRQYWIQI